ncbi:hypothetical protein J3F83DRAFT_549092 [Trichoderma novae-zelandiae]
MCVCTVASREGQYLASRPYLIPAIIQVPDKGHPYLEALQTLLQSKVKCNVWARKPASSCHPMQSNTSKPFRQVPRSLRLPIQNAKPTPNVSLLLFSLPSKRQNTTTPSPHPRGGITPPFQHHASFRKAQPNCPTCPTPSISATTAFRSLLHSAVSAPPDSSKPRLSSRSIHMSSFRTYPCTALPSSAFHQPRDAPLPCLAFYLLLGSTTWTPLHCISRIGSLHSIRLQGEVVLCMGRGRLLRSCAYMANRVAVFPAVETVNNSPPSNSGAYEKSDGIPCNWRHCVLLCDIKDNSILNIANIEHSP